MINHLGTRRRAGFILRLEEHPNHARQGSAGVSSARLSHIDQCVERHLKANGRCHFDHGCSEHNGDYKGTRVVVCYSRPLLCSRRWYSSGIDSWPLCVPQIENKKHSLTPRGRSLTPRGRSLTPRGRRVVGPVRSREWLAPSVHLQSAFQNPESRIQNPVSALRRPANPPPVKGRRNIAWTRCCTPKTQVTIVYRFEDLISDPRNHAPWREPLPSAAVMELGGAVGRTAAGKSPTARIPSARLHRRAGVSIARRRAWHRQSTVAGG